MTARILPNVSFSLTLTILTVSLTVLDSLIIWIQQLRFLLGDRSYLHSGRINLLKQWFHNVAVSISQCWRNNLEQKNRIIAPNCPMFFFSLQVCCTHSLRPVYTGDFCCDFSGEIATKSQQKSPLVSQAFDVCIPLVLSIYILLYSSSLTFCTPKASEFSYVEDLTRTQMCY